MFRSLAVPLAAALAIAPLPGQARMLHDTATGAASSEPSMFTQAGQHFYFTARSSGVRRLWRSDGTGEGTHLVSGRPANPTQLTFVNGRVFFAAEDAARGRELWVSDGTDAGTRLVMDIRFGAESSNPTSLVRFNGMLYLQADDGIRGAELWKSDGTSNGTSLVKDIEGGGDGSTPAGFLRFGETLIFSATTAVDGRELWRTDGTSVGTKRIRDIRTGIESSDPQHLTFAFDVAYFTARTGDNRALMKTDGTSDGTVVVDPKTNVRGPLTMLGKHVMFASFGEDLGYELWQSDGTAAGTALVKDINPGGGREFGSDPADFVVVRSQMFFTARDANHGRELWITDRTEKGTVRLADIRPGVPSGIPESGHGDNMSRTGVIPRVFFAAIDRDGDRELWVSDGTIEGTYRAQDLRRTGSSEITDLHVFGNKVVFAADDGVHGEEPWIVDAFDACCGSITSYGKGCRGTGREFQFGPRQNDAKPTFAHASPEGQTYAIEVHTPKPVNVVGYELLTATRSSRREMSVSLHPSTRNGRPAAQPLATSTMILPRVPGTGLATFDPPVRIPAGRFFLTMNAFEAHMSIVQSGLRSRSFHRQSFDSTWKESQRHRWYYRVICEVPGDGSPILRGKSPFAGRTMTIELAGAKANTVAILLHGISDERWGPIPLPLDLGPIGAPGCRLWTSADLMLIAFTNRFGAASMQFPLPNAPDLIGQRMFQQWSVVDKAANAVGIAYSNAARIVIGR